jgi:hypothetical protein
MALYRRKFGEQRMAQMIPHMQKVGLADGITFDYRAVVVQGRGLAAGQGCGGIVQGLL